jgi:CDP-diacylglycerol--glycerol-3-phosphate 3-phosphatidyltransferase
MTRVLIAPLFIVLMLTDDPGYIILGCFLYLLAAISDYIDGWYARKFGMITKWGQFFDPLADKILTTSAFIVFYIFDIIPLWMIAVIVLRDVVTTLFRIMAISKKSVLETSYPAKFKTSVQMVFIAFVLVFLFIKYTCVFDIMPETADKIIYSSWTYYTMLLLTLLTVWTLIDYIFRNKSLLSKIWSDFTKKKLANE